MEKTERLIEHLTQSSVERGIIEKDDVAIYRYGVKQLLVAPIYFCSYIAIGVLTQNLFWLSVYLFAFTAIRVFAGGFHTKSRYTCFIVTMALVTIISILLKQYERFIHIPVWIIMLMAGYGIIMWLAPVGNKKRNLDEEEKVHFRKATVLMVNVELFIGGVSLVLHAYHLGFVMVVALVQEAIFLILGIAGKESLE